MAKDKTSDIIDKQTQINNYVTNLLWLKNIIDAHGNILNLDRYRSEVELVKMDREAEFQKNTTVDGVVIDRELASVLVGEIEYLNGILKHTKNIKSLSEHPIVSYEDQDHPVKKWWNNLGDSICTLYYLIKKRTR